MPHILIVDDDASNRDLLVQMLTLAGYTTSEASHGAEALSYAQRAVPDMVIIDLAMPIMDGWTTIRRLKQDPALKALPVVVVTAYDTRDATRRAWEAGCNVFMTKPVDYHRLLDTVQHQLANRPPTA